MFVSKTDQLWQYAKEAILSACYTKTDEDKQGLLELARIWTQAALQSESPLVDHDSYCDVGGRIFPPGKVSHVCV